MTAIPMDRTPCRPDRSCGCVRSVEGTSILHPLSSILYLLPILFLAATPVQAQKVGTSSMQFLKVTPTARGAALGSAYAALGRGAEAVYWNPAGLTSAYRHDLLVERVDWFMDAAHYAFSYVAGLGTLGHVGVHVYVASMGDVEETRVDHLSFVDRGGRQVYNPGLTGHTFSPQSWVVGLSYARRLTDRFSAGLSVKYAQEDLYLSKAGVPLFDFGMTYDTNFRSLHLGASVVHFGPPVKFERDSYPAPMTFRIGAAADVIGVDGLAPVHSTVNRVTVSYDLIQPNDYDQQYAAGLEYAFVDRFFLRGGYQFNFDAESFSLGAGVRQPIGALHVRIDYAYSDMGGILESVHRLGLRLHLE